MPQLVLTRLREASGQLGVMHEHYGHFSQDQQARFTAEAQAELRSIQSHLETLGSVSAAWDDHHLS